MSRLECLTLATCLCYFNVVGAAGLHLAERQLRPFVITDASASTINGGDICIWDNPNVTCATVGTGCDGVDCGGAQACPKVGVNVKRNVFPAPMYAACRTQFSGLTDCIPPTTKTVCWISEKCGPICNNGNIAGNPTTVCSSSLNTDSNPGDEGHASGSFCGG